MENVFSVKFEIKMCQKFIQILRYFCFFFCRKLFVGGLSWESTQESLSKYFSRFGDVIDCVVRTFPLFTLHERTYYNIMLYYRKYMCESKQGILLYKCVIRVLNLIFFVYLWKENFFFTSLKTR